MLFRSRLHLQAQENRRMSALLRGGTLSLPSLSFPLFSFPPLACKLGEGGEGEQCLAGRTAVKTH